jgi:hypothetical protein
MTEAKQQLQSTLLQLHSELAQIDPDDPRVRTLLEGAVAEIQSVLGQPATSRDASLIDRLKESAKNFEDTHPTLANTIGSVVDSLSQMGI